MTSKTFNLQLVAVVTFTNGQISNPYPIEYSKSDPIAKFYRINDTGDYEPVTNFNYFNPSARTFIVIHGWMENHSSDQYQLICNDLKTLHGGNVAMVDYGKMSQEFYGTCAKFIVETVGTFLGQNLINAVQSGYTTQARIHLIGHSLGAHVAGKGSVTLKAATGKTAECITGLDPGNPFLQLDLSMLEDELNSNQATFVDCVHTTTLIGTMKTCGDEDFYVLGVLFFPFLQKPCIVTPSVACSHGMSKSYFRESINSTEMVAERYYGTGPRLSVFGYHVKISLTGIYYFEPSSTPPYGRGQPICLQ